jgi:hypothetical protein
MFRVTGLTKMSHGKYFTLRQGEDTENAPNWHLAKTLRQGEDTVPKMRQMHLAHFPAGVKTGSGFLADFLQIFNTNCNIVFKMVLIFILFEIVQYCTALIVTVCVIARMRAVIYFVS